MNYNNNDFFVDEEDLTGKPSKEDRILAAVCYAHFLFLVPFLMQKDSEFLKFHMRQGGVLYVLFFSVNIVLAILILITGSLRFLGLELLLFVAYTILGIFVGYKAYLGYKYELGFLKQIVEKIKDIMDQNESKKSKDDDQNYY